MIVTISFNAAPGARDLLVERLTEILPDTRAFEGCNDVMLVEHTATPGALLLIEDWESAEHYEAYKKWRRDSGTSVLGTDLIDRTSLESSTFIQVAHPS